MSAIRRVTTGIGLVAAILMLSACSLAPGVASDALSYHQTADVTANSIILLNVLRAKDDAPLHFGELSLQHGQISEQGGLSLSQPVGQIPHSSSLPRSILTPTGSVGDQVSFDLGTLDTQTFTQGVTSPIAPKMLKYFLDTGIDHRLVVLLLVAGVRLPGHQEAIANFPRSERVICYPTGFPAAGVLPTDYEMRAVGENGASCPYHEREFLAFLRVMNGLRRIYAIAYRPVTPIGAPFRPDVAKELHDLATLDSSKEQLRPEPGGKMQLVSVAPDDKVVLCEEAPSGAGPGPIAVAAAKAPAATPDSICGATNASVVNTDSDQSPAAGTAVPDFTLRSTLGIFSFLGQVLGSQEDRSKSGDEVCIRLDAQAGASARPRCDQGQVLFHLTHDQARSRFGVMYDGQYWGVPNVPPCLSTTGYCDHTLETLSMLSLLLNLNKSARDIPSTPAVQLVP